MELNKIKKNYDNLLLQLDLANNEKNNINKELNLLKSNNNKLKGENESTWRIILSY